MSRQGEPICLLNHNRQVRISQVVRLPEDHSPRKEQRDFDIEDNEQQGHHVESQVELNKA